MDPDLYLLHIRIRVCETGQTTLHYHDGTRDCEHGMSSLDPHATPDFIYLFVLAEIARSFEAGSDP